MFGIFLVTLDSNPARDEARKNCRAPGSAAVQGALSLRERAGAEGVTAGRKEHRTSNIAL